MRERFKGSTKGKGKGTGLKSMTAAGRKRRKPNLFNDFDRHPIVPTTITDTGTQTYTVPNYVDTVTVTMYGGGGGGGMHYGARGNDTDGGGGGGGARVVVTIDEIAAGTVLTFENGIGGAYDPQPNQNSADGGDTTFSYGGVDYVAGGGEGSAGGYVLMGAKDGTGGVADCDGGANCVETPGNDGTPMDSTRLPGIALGDDAGAGGAGGDDGDPSGVAHGLPGKVIIS